MSLLMDALRKAEREKSRANSSNGNLANFPDHAATPDETAAASQPETNLTTDIDSTDKIYSDPKDESWAFDSDELELEPIVKKLSESEVTEEQNNFFLDDDPTLIEPLPLDRDLADAIQSLEPDLTIQSDAESHKSDFDHDATLPSERAIQSSLKDYFEASQSITLEQSSANAAKATDTTEHSITSTSPLDTSATHVTAHTIFTAGQTRPISTGLGKYAMFGTLALGLGLGSVALYYSYVTPKVISMPTDMASIASMVEPSVKPPTKAVSINALSVETSTSPNSSQQASVEIEDAVLAEIVKELPTIEQVSQPRLSVEVPSSEEIQQAPSDVVIKAPINEIENATIEVVPEQATAFNEAPVVIKPETSLAKIEPTPLPSYQAQTPATTPVTTSTNDVLYSPEYHSPKVAEPEEAIIRNDREYQTKALKGGYTPNKAVVKNEQAFEVMSAADFSKELHVPQSAIKITKGHSHRASRTDLEMAYQAYQRGDFITAKSAYRKVLSRRPDSRDARLGVAAIAVMEGNHEKAYRNYHYLLQQNPQDQVVNAALFNLQGNTAGHSNESQLKMSLDQNPNSPQVHFSLGSFYAGQARWPEAQQSFFDAFSSDKNNGDYAYNLAVSLDQMGQAKSALSYYRSALKLADNRQVSFNTSKVLARIQKLSGIVKN